MINRPPGELIITLAIRHELPAIYPERLYVSCGRSNLYGVGYVDQYRRAAGYVDRILKGEKATELPVRQRDEYELLINLKVAKSLGLAPPAGLVPGHPTR